MIIRSVLRPELVRRLKAMRKEAVLAELARLAASALPIREEGIRAALVAREVLGSTGVGVGIALPHARLSGIDRPLAAFVQLSKACDWHAIDGAPVDLILLLLSPATDDATHLSVLAAFMRRFRQPGFGDQLRSAPDTDSIYRRLTSTDGVQEPRANGRTA